MISYAIPHRFLGLLLSLTLYTSLHAATIGNEVELTAGHHPYCTTDKNGVLHVIYRSKSGDGIYHITYNDVTGQKSSPQKVASRNGYMPWLAIDWNGNVHAVWTEGEFARGGNNSCHYTSNIGGSWKTPISLPQTNTGDKMNTMVTVTTGYGSEVYAAAWDWKEDYLGSTLYYRIENHQATILFQQGGCHRPGSVWGSNPMDKGDGKVYGLDGQRSPKTFVINKDGSRGDATGFGAPATAEGAYCCFIGTDEIGATFSAKEHARPAYVTTNKQPVVEAGTSSKYCNFNKMAYCPVADRVYVLYLKDNKAAVAKWNRTQKNVEQLGVLNNSTCDFGSGKWGSGHGIGAGGIAQRRGGGIHTVYAIGGKIYYRSIDAQSQGTHIVSLPLSGTNMQADAVKIFTLQGRVVSGMPHLRGTDLKHAGGMFIRSGHATPSMILLEK